MPTRLLWALAAIVLISFLMSRKTRKRRQSSWTGVVTEIRHQRPSITQDEDRADDEWVTVLYRTDEEANGKFKLRMAGLRQFLPGLRAGDRLVKRQGDYLPRKAPAEAPVATADPA